MEGQFVEGITRSINKRENHLRHLSEKIWDYSEVRFETPQSSLALKAFLRTEGFEITSPVAGMEHAFIATYGQGRTHVGLLAEFDALENMSQESQAYEKKSCDNKTAGHGCGHNLLGVGAVAAALAIKDYIDENPNLGKVSVFGAPAEESGYGKAFMARAGCFNELDFALTWHPYDLTAVWGERTLAVYQVYFRFKGKSAHASAAPELGRSALDAAELMYHHAQTIDANFDKKDLKHAKKYHNKEVDPSFIDRLSRYYPNKTHQEILDLSSQAINNELAQFSIWDRGYASTDVGDVSWNVPTAQMFVTCEPHGTPMHSWQWVDNGLSDFAHKGMIRASKIMAKTALDVIKNPALLKQIQEEFKQKTEGKPYVSAIPKEVVPKQSL